MGMTGRAVSVFAAAIVAAAWACDAAPEDAATALAKRVLGDRAREFAFRTVPAENGLDVFEVEASGGKATIGGSNGVAMASGLNWYLKYGCNASVSWCGDHLSLPSPLPDMPKARMKTPLRYRYYFNYCTFSYSMAWWDWDRWEREIDWMALNGINMPLAVTGQEAVWQKVYRDLGLTNDQLDRFFVGPAYLPFGWMGCMDGWGGPLSQSWLDRHRELQQKIVARERELGMTPVLQGFTGHVPPDIQSVFPAAKLRQLPSWCGFPGTWVLDPTDPLFTRIGKAFVDEQTRLFGTDHLYASDTFIEMSPPSDDLAFLADMGRAIHGAMAASDPEAIWVMQGWVFVNNPKFWQPPQAKALLGAVPDDRMILLDLFCESDPAWKKTESFHGKPWVWGIVHNFGGGVGLFGRLQAIGQEFPEALASPDRARLCGSGMIMEGIGTNPVVYDLMSEVTWRAEPVATEPWLRQYAVYRYGAPDEHADRAWRLLSTSVYQGNTSPGRVLTARPSLSGAQGWTAGPVNYDMARVCEAAGELLAASGNFAQVDTYRYDVVNVTRQVLADLSQPLYTQVIDAYQRKDREGLQTACERFLELVRDVDTLAATRREFLLGRWLADARRWGADDAERAHYEWNARNQITLWGPKDSILHEYAQKQWAGLLAGFYLPRWERFFDRLEESLQKGRPFDGPAFVADVSAWEEAWTHGDERYADEPTGDSVEIARTLLAKYRPQVEDLRRPEITSLTTGKPARSSSNLPNFPAHLACDGIVSDTNRFWATDVGRDPNPWWQVDLEEPVTVGRVVVIAFFGDDRYYGFTVETSLDGTTWEMAADRRGNTALSTREGYTCDFTPRKARHIRVTEPVNSANTGRHLVEVMAYEAAK